MDLRTIRSIAGETIEITSLILSCMFSFGVTGSAYTTYNNIFVIDNLVSKLTSNINFLVLLINNNGNGIILYFNN